MRHRANPRFWRAYEQLPEDIQRLADKSYALLERDPRHPSLHFKKVGRSWSARVGLFYRAPRLKTRWWQTVNAHAKVGLCNGFYFGRSGMEYVGASSGTSRTSFHPSVAHERTR